MLPYLAATAGFVVYLGLIALGAFYIGRTALKHRLFVPVVVAVIARLTVVVIVHAASVANGRSGALYLDDAGYARAAWRIAKSWRHGHPTEAATAHIVNAFGGPLYYDLIAAAFFLVGPSKLAVEVAGALLGGATTMLAARLAGKVVSSESARPMAWATALMPTVLWWSVPMLKEAVIVPLVLGTLLSAVGLPSRRATVMTSALLVATAAVRLSFGVALAAPLVVWFLLVSIRGRSNRAGILLRAGGGLAILLIVAVVVPTAGQPWRAPHVYIDTLSRLRHAYSDSVGSNLADEFHVHHGLAGFLGGVVRMLFSPRAWAANEVPFDWYQPLFFGMWFWYCAWGLIIGGLWRLRQSSFALVMVLASIFVLSIYALTGESGVRQRSAFEPLLLLFAVAGASGPVIVLTSCCAGLLAASALVIVDAKEFSQAFELLLLAGPILLTIGLCQLNGRVPRFLGLAQQPVANLFSLPAVMILAIGGFFLTNTTAESGTMQLRTDELNSYALPRARDTTVDGRWSINQYGLVLAPGRSGSATYKFRKNPGEALDLKLWFYARPPRLENALRTSIDGAHYKLIATNANFIGRNVALTGEAVPAREVWVQFSASTRRGSSHFLVLDKVEAAVVKRVTFPSIMNVFGPMLAALVSLWLALRLLPSRENTWNLHASQTDRAPTKVRQMVSVRTPGAKRRQSTIARGSSRG